MNKLCYGSCAVSRYHQIQQIYLSTDKLKLPDHDFPLAYKTIPSGIMMISHKRNIEVSGINKQNDEKCTKLINLSRNVDESEEEHISRLQMYLYSSGREMI